ncbi:MAG: hypothetical protein ACRYFY_03430 [Janthinobacterium lividum]
MPFDALHQPDAVTRVDGIYRIESDGLPHMLTRSGQPLRSFGQGLNPVALSRLLRPLLLLELGVEDGTAEPWWFDTAFEHAGSGLDGLSTAHRRIVVDIVRPILDWLAEDRLADGQPEPVAAFLSLQRPLRQALQRLSQDRPEQPMADASVLDRPPAAAPADHTLAVSERPGAAGQPPVLAIGHTGLIVRQGDAPATLLPGWRALRVCTLFFPTLLLELVHDRGETAIWYLDHQGRSQGHQAQHLHPAARHTLARAIQPMFEALWHELLLDPAPVLSPTLDRFLRLAESTRLDLLALRLQNRTEAGIASPTRFWTLTEPLPRTLGHVVQTRLGQFVLDPAHLRAACLQSLHESFGEQMRLGETSWPSPIDGVPVRTTLRPLTIDNLCFAYQLHDPRHDLTFHVVALEWHFRTFGIYLPGIDLMVTADQAATDRLRLYCLDFAELLQRHLATYGDGIAIGIARRRTGALGPLLQVFRGEPSLHIGHSVWQDLSGLDWLIRNVPADRLPHCLVFDSQLQAEMYGPIDHIHPSLQGRVIRRDGRFRDSIRTFYETSARLMKITAIQVRHSVGIQVMDAIDHEPACAAERDAADAIPPGTPVILLGLRVGNRAPEDQAGYLCRLVARLAALDTPLRPVIVLDGHNQAAEGATYRSVGDEQSGALGLIDAERAIAARLAATCARLDVRVVDTVGKPVAHSLIWCRRAQFFVAPWGAALAKYRWICNRPGIVVTGRWNLTSRHDLDIYSDPKYLEAPAELRFLSAAHVEDVMLAGQPPDRANFRVDEEAVFTLVGQFTKAYPG